MIVEGKMWWTLAILLIHSAKISWCGGGSSNGKVGYVRAVVVRKSIEVLLPCGWCFITQSLVFLLSIVITDMFVL